MSEDEIKTLIDAMNVKVPNEVVVTSLSTVELEHRELRLSHNLRLLDEVDEPLSQRGRDLHSQLAAARYEMNRRRVNG